MLKIVATEEYAAQNVTFISARSARSNGRKLLCDDRLDDPLSESCSKEHTEGGSGGGRALLQSSFKAYAVCKLNYDKNYIGGNIRKNFKSKITTWQACCAECYKRTDCKAWTLNKGPRKSERGCYLKGKGYKTKNAKGYISGTMTTNNREYVCSFLCYYRKQHIHSLPTLPQHKQSQCLLHLSFANIRPIPRRSLSSPTRHRSIPTITPTPHRHPLPPTPGCGLNPPSPRRGPLPSPSLSPPRVPCSPSPPRWKGQVC